MKIIYDFDGTLTPRPIPKFKILEKCGINDEEYYKMFRELKISIQKNNLNLFEVFYNAFLKILKEAKINPTVDNLSYGSLDIEYNKGLIKFLKYTVDNNINNYLLSSGMKDYLNNTEVAKYFKEIYGTTFKLENDNYVVDYLMTDENKVSVIKSITKGNCKDVIYIGDGLTDLPAMEYVKNNGGISIFLVHNNDILNKIDQSRYISFLTKPDYSSDSELFQYVENILKRK